MWIPDGTPLSEPPVGTPCPDRIPEPQRFLPDSAVAGPVRTAGPSGATGSPPVAARCWPGFLGGSQKAVKCDIEVIICL